MMFGHFLKWKSKIKKKKQNNKERRMKEQIKLEKVVKHVTNVHNETIQVIFIRNLKKALSHRLSLKKVT